MPGRKGRYVTIVCGGLAAATVLVAGLLLMDRYLTSQSKIQPEHSREQIQILQEKLVRLQVYKDDLMQTTNRKDDLDDRIKALNAEIAKVEQELLQYKALEIQKPLQPGNKSQRNDLAQKMVRLLILRDEILNRPEGPERASALQRITDEIRTINQKISELK
jgi:hypothetical protein